MTKQEVLLLALDSTIQDMMKYDPEDWKNTKEETRKCVEVIYLRAQQKRKEILEIINGEKELEE